MQHTSALRHILIVITIVIASFTPISGTHAASAGLDVRDVWWVAPDTQLNIQLIMPPVPENGGVYTITYPGDRLALSETLIEVFDWQRDEASNWHFVQIGTVQADNGTGIITITLDLPEMARGEFLERFPPIIRLDGQLLFACGQDTELLPAFDLTFVTSSGNTFSDRFPGYICHADGGAIEGQLGLLTDTTTWSIDSGDLVSPASMVITTSESSPAFACDSIKLTPIDGTSVTNEADCSEHRIQLSLESEGIARAVVTVETARDDATSIGICLEARTVGENVFAATLIPGSGLATDTCMESHP